jgi:subtilisin family serine protease
MRDHYTYHRGKHLPLIIDHQHFISRAPLELLHRAKFDELKQASAHSFLVTVPEPRKPDALSKAMTLAQDLGYAAFHEYLIPDYDESPDGASPFRVTDRIFVTFKQPMSNDELAAFNAQYATEKLADKGDMKFLFRTAPNVNPLEVVRDLTEYDKRVELAEHDVNHRVFPQLTLPEDPKYPFEWHLHDVTGDRRVTPAGSIHAQEAWEALQSRGDRDVVIAVIDFAFDVANVDLADAGKIAGSAYFVKNTTKNELITSNDVKAKAVALLEGPAEFVTHGTICAALAAGAVNRGGMVGVAPGCSLHLLKLPHDEKPGAVISDTDFIMMIRHLRDKVDVVTSSWAPNDPQSHWSREVAEELADAAVYGGRRPGKGIVFFWGAGNLNRPLVRSFRSNVPVPYEIAELRDGKVRRLKRARTFIDDLVGLPNVLHVAASTSNGCRAPVSKYGYGVGIAAPSTNFDSFGWTVSVLSAELCTTALQFGGTSAAAPIAAGVAALVISANGDLTAQETISILKQTAERDQLDVTTQVPRARFGALGVSAAEDVSPVHPFEDGTFREVGDHDGPRSHWFGFGRVDAHKAVQAALAMKTPKANAATRTKTQTKAPAAAVAR